MSVWTGWQADLLSAASFPNSSANRAFLTAWHQHANSNCARNPVDISKQTGKWSACKHLDAGRTANNYGNVSSAKQAFADQVAGSEFLFLNSGFYNSSLTVTTASADVIAEVALWGSTTFAAYLQGQVSGGGAGAKGVAPKTHAAWNDLRRSVNRNFHGDVKQANRNVSAALRSLGRARKVKL